MTAAGSHCEPARARSVRGHFLISRTEERKLQVFRESTHADGAPER